MPDLTTGFTDALFPALFTSPSNPDFGPQPYQGGAQPAALTPTSRLAAGTPYVIGVSSPAQTTTPVQIPVTTATGRDDVILVLSTAPTTANGAPVVTGVSDTKLNGYTQGPFFAPGVKTTLGLPGDVHQGLASTPLTTADSIFVAFAGSLNGMSCVAIGVPRAARAGVDQQAVTHTPSVTTVSATTPVTLWPGEQAIALFANTNAGGAPTSLGGFTQLTQVHTAAAVYLTAAYLPVASTSAVTASFTCGVSGNMTVIVVTVPGLDGADPSAFDASSLEPPGMFLSPAGQPHPAPPQQFAQPSPLPPSVHAPPVQVQAIPPGLFISPGALPFIPPVPQQFAQPPPIPPGTGLRAWHRPGPPPGLFISPGGLPFIPPTPQQPVSPPVAPPSLVQQVTGSFSNVYGITSVPFTSTEGNALVVLAGWDLSTLPTSAPMPRVDVCDSAGNLWEHLATTPNTQPASRCCAWIVPNALPVGNDDQPGWVSVSTSGYTSSLAYVVLEITSMPSLASLSVRAVGAPAGASNALSLSGLAGEADVAFALLTAAAAPALLTSGPAGWVPLAAPLVTGTAPVQILPYWMPSAPAGTLGATWILSPELISGLIVAIEASPQPPVQPAPNFPALRVEAGFGYTPGDPSQPPPEWTNITARCIGKDGTPFIEPEAGREYELTEPEAGTIAVSCNNLDGALTPGNTASIYYPNVVVGTPVRVQAYWAGRWWPIAYGYVERWPQEWPDMPQWGMSKMIATDAVSVTSNTTMPSALQGEILIDAPYVYLPMGEQYLSQNNGLSATTGGALQSFSSAEAAGLLAANISRTNQRTGMYADGILTGAPLPAETGAALNLLGDQGTGFGISSINGNVIYGHQPVTGPGVIYTDPNLPSPSSANGVSAEVWFTYNATVTVANQGVTLFQAFAPPSAYWPTTGAGPGSAPTSFTISIANPGGPNVVQFAVNGTVLLSVPFTESASPQQIVASISPASSPIAASCYLNGQPAGSFSVPSLAGVSWPACVFGPGAFAYSSDPYLQDFTLGHGVIYPYALPASRVAAHYSTGFAGASGVTVSQGASMILDWGYLGLPRGGPAQFGGGDSDGIALGPFYSVAGSPAADGMNSAVVSDGGMIFAAPTGVLTVLPKWAIFNLQPMTVFGDAIDGSECPFLPGQSFDYDNQYLVNVAAVTRDNGPTTSVTATVVNTPSQASYFTRGPQSQQVTTTSDLDAFTLANNIIAGYDQPAMRVRNLAVDAYVTGQFTTVLSTQIGQVAAVNRRPIPGAVISGNYQVQKRAFKIGPLMFGASFEMSPYTLNSAILTLDTPGYNAVGSMNLG